MVAGPASDQCLEIRFQCLHPVGGDATDAGAVEMSVEQMIDGWNKLGFLEASNGRFEETSRG